MHVDPFAPVAVDLGRDPPDTNQAIPTLLFATVSARRGAEHSILAGSKLMDEPACGSDGRRISELVLMPAGVVWPQLCIEGTNTQYLIESSI